MASVDVEAPSTTLPAFFAEKVQAFESTDPSEVEAVLNYFKDNEDGSPPAPAYVDRPETYERSPAPRQVKITNIAGREAEFSLDKQGFEIICHVAEERDFTDEDHIKAVYYPETEQLLKDV